MKYRITQADSVVITVTYHNDKPFVDQRYSILRPGDTEPGLSGRTDPDGRIAFRPDTTGTWNVRTYSADGHGLNIPVQVDSLPTVTETPPAPGITAPPDSAAHATGPAGNDSRRTIHVLLGVVIILGLFNLYLFILKKKKSHPLS